MIEIKKNVPMEEVFPLVEELTAEHWEEIANNKEAIKLAPDKEKFLMLQKVGVLTNAFAYDDGRVIGYVVVLTNPHLHYMFDKIAFVDVIYLKKKYRNSSLGVRLVKMAEELAREAGASVITHHTKPHHVNLEKIITKMNYKFSESIFTKLIKE